MNVLLRLASGFGLGDVVAFSVVLKHLRRYRPGWVIDVQAPRGAHAALNGLCRRAFRDDFQSELPGFYQADTPLAWADPGVCYPDRPSTKPAYFLPVQFGIPYDQALGRYELRVSATARAKAAAELAYVPKGFVAFHHEGASAKPSKDLTSEEAAGVIKAVDAAGCPSLLLRGHLTDPLATDAELLAAVISRARAFVGIDSGPSKVAACTGIPCLVVWTGHHPVQHFDPMPNVTHLVPANHRGLLPPDDKLHILQFWSFFGKNYQFRTYGRREDIPSCVGEWMRSL